MLFQMVGVYGAIIKILLSSDDTWEEISPGKSRNTMKMEHLSRAELNTELECQVANSIPARCQVPGAR